MALVVERSGPTASSTLMNKPRQCFTCKQRKDGLFTLDAYGHPMCADCAHAAKRPID